MIYTLASGNNKDILLVVGFNYNLALYGLGNMLDIPQQNPLKYGFSGIEVNILLVSTEVSSHRI